MFRTTSIAIFLASASSVAAQAELCFPGTYDDLFPMDLGPPDCNGMTLFNLVKKRFSKNKKANNKLDRKDRIKCKQGADKEFAALTNSASKDEGFDYISTACNNALGAASEELGSGDWGTIEDADVSVDEFFMGGGFLNSETGNFQQDPAKFKNNRDKFIYMGDDPRLNDHYPTTEDSYAAGQAIQTMYEDESRNYFFEAPAGFEGGCTSNTAMCCWHRDRQYFDDNGNCNPADCANANPGDNTDLCWTELDGEVFPYPGSDTENSLHCHGLAWGNGSSGIDINAKGKWNTLFYVSMYDHLKERGYAEGLGQDPDIMVEQPMCGCVEDMAPVARADCSEIVGTASYTATLNDEGILQIEHVEDTFKLEFQACEGYQYNEIADPENFATTRPKDLGLKGKNNDLSAFVFKNYLKKQMTGDQVEIVKETLIGYEDPSVNKGDEEREAACAAAFEKKFPGREYEEKEVEEEEEEEDEDE